MPICNRQTPDPLVGALIAKRVNPLLWVREQSPVGVIYAIERRDGMAQEIWTPNIALTPPLTPPKAEPLTTGPDSIIEQALSQAYGLDATASVLGRFLPGNASGDALAALKSAGAAKASFKLVGLAGERLPVDQLQMALQNRRLHKPFDELAGSKRLYFATGGWSAQKLQITVLDKKNHSVDVKAALEQALSGQAGLRLTTNARDQLFVTSTAPLYFGVELMEMVRGIGGFSLKGYRPRNAVAGEEEEAAAVQRLADIWEPQDELALDNGSAD